MFDKTQTSQIHYLYRITNTQNSKIYIGQTVNPTKRWGEHRRVAATGKSNLAIHRAINKHGVDCFSFEVIACCKAWENANELETLLIQQYSCKTPAGYNIALGGFNAPRSEEWKQRMRELWTDPAFRDRIIQANLGRIPWNKDTTGIMKPNSGSFQMQTVYPNDDRLLAMVNDNGLTETAKLLGITAGTLHHQLEKRGLKHDRKPGSNETTFQKGSRHSRSKLTEQQVLEIVDLYGTGNYTKVALAKQFGVNDMTIKKIITGQTWSYITGIKPKVSA